MGTLITACGDNPKPTPAPFGLDTRPSNTTCIAPDRPVIDTGVALQRMWPGITFTAPMFLTQAPGDNDTWYVVERGSEPPPTRVRGRIRKLATNATGNGDVKDFVTVDVNASGEGGLLAFAFHPNWQTNHDAYLSYTRDKKGGDPPPTCSATADHVFTSVVARFHSGDGGQTLDPNGVEILNVGQPYSNHNGGYIQFGKDGALYFGLGDGGSANDPCGSGQNQNSLLGKMLRLDVDAGGAPEIWASGLRNPWRWSFDRDTGDLWLGDVGQGAWEEIDKIEQGGNYGWNTCEGFHRFGSTAACATPGLRDPIVEHKHPEAYSITGGYVYRGSAIPGLVGRYVYGDFGSGTIWALTYDVNGRPVPKPIASAPGLASFGQGNDGELYTVQLNSGIISKLVPSGTPGADTFPDLLSQTGCVDPQDPTKPASGLIPYDVISPLWSDGATKQRFLAIPDGTTIDIGDDGDWDLPIGSVTMKNFVVADKLVETRLFMRHADGNWAGYSYEWNDAGTDAALLPGSLVKPLGNGSEWGYPSRDECLQCHSLAAGGTLGLETAQLNRDAVYPSTNRISNQLATIDHIGMFSAPLPAAPTDLPRLVDPAGSDAAELRARSYLHSNCSHCHRPMGGGQGTLDLRAFRSFADTMTCNLDNMRGPVGNATKLLVPGDPASSILSLRVHATDDKRMPPLAVRIPDPTGTAVIDEWITSLTTCP